MTLILQTAALLKNSVHAPRRLRGSLLYEVRVQVGSQLGLISSWRCCGTTDRPKPSYTPTASKYGPAVTRGPQCPRKQTGLDKHVFSD